MTDRNNNIEAKFKIDILLKEYDTLRAEILQRINARFGIIGFLGTLFAFVLSKWEWQPKNCSFDVRWPIVALGLTVLLGTWWWFGIRMQRLAARVSSIEKRVNQLAGEELLTWETYYGWGRLWKTRENK